MKLKYCIFKLLFSNAVNLLSNVPVSCLDVLICPLTHEETAQEATTLDELPSDKTAEKETVLKNNTMVYNGMNMEAIHVLLNFMEKRIDKVRLIKRRPWEDVSKECKCAIYADITGCLLNLSFFLIADILYNCTLEIILLQYMISFKNQVNLFV